MPWSYHSPMRHTISTTSYPLNQLPHVSPNNLGHLELKNLSTHGEAGWKYCSMYNTRYMSHVNYIEHVQNYITSFFCKKCCEKICKPHLQHIFEEVKTSETQEKRREWSNLILFIFFFQKCPFWTYFKKKSAHSLFGAWSLFLVHIRFTPSEGPKDFVNMVV